MNKSCLTISLLCIGSMSFAETPIHNDLKTNNVSAEEQEDIEIIDRVPVHLDLPVEEFEPFEEEEQEIMNAADESLEGWEILEGDAYLSNKDAAVGDFSLLLPPSVPSAIVRHTLAHPTDADGAIYYDFYLRAPVQDELGAENVIDVNGAAIGLVFNEQKQGVVTVLDGAQGGEWLDTDFYFENDADLLQKNWMQVTVVTESSSLWHLYLNGELYAENLTLSSKNASKRNSVFYLLGNATADTFIDSFQVYSDTVQEEEMVEFEPGHNAIPQSAAPDLYASELSQVQFPDPDRLIMSGGKLRRVADVFHDHLVSLETTAYEYKRENIIFVDNAIGSDSYCGSCLSHDPVQNIGPKATLAGALAAASPTDLCGIIIMPGKTVYPEASPDYGLKPVTIIQMGDFIVGRPEDIAADIQRDYFKPTAQLLKAIESIHFQPSLTNNDKPITNR